MRLSVRHLAASGLALALLGACAKQHDLPVAQLSGAGEQTIATGQTYILDASQSGADVSVEWSIRRAPAGSKATIEAPNQPITRFTPDVPSSSELDPYVIRLVVRNKYYDSVPADLTLHVLDCGANAPEVTSITPTPVSGGVGQAVQLTAAVQDKDDLAACSGKTPFQQLTYKWSLVDLPAGSRAKLSSASALSPSFTPDIAGNYGVQLVVTDSTGRSSPLKPVPTTIAVRDCGKAPPVVTSMSANPQTPNLNQAVLLSAQPDDPDESTSCGTPRQKYGYQWSIVGLPANSMAQLNSATAETPSFTPDVPGDYTFQLLVTDSTGLVSPPSTHTVTARACGGAPPTPIVSFSPASVGVGTAVGLSATPNDADAACGVAETFTYAWSLRAVPAGSRASVRNPTASDTSFTPDMPGDYQVDVQIADSSGTRASTSTHVTVLGCGSNAPAVAVAGLPDTPLVGQQVVVNANVSDADSTCPGYVGDQKYTWKLVTLPSDSAAAIADPSARTATFIPDVPGTYQVQLVVTDATGLASAPALATFTTSACGLNKPRIAAAGADNPNPDPGRTVSLFAQATDVDNQGSCALSQNVTVLWTLTSKPAGSNASLSNPTTTHPSFVPDVIGSYQFSVVATDDTGRASDPGWVSITTTSCGAATPTVSASPAIVTASPLQSVQLSAQPTDANSSCGVVETFRYAWSFASVPDGASPMLSDPGAAAPIFRTDLAGEYLLAVTVQDAGGRTSNPAFVKISIASCGSLPPVIGSLSASPTSLGQPVTLSANGVQDRNCVSSGITSYAWELVSKPYGSQAMLSDPSALTPTFTPDLPGAYQAKLVVKDALGLVSLPAFVSTKAVACSSSNIVWGQVSTLTFVDLAPTGSFNFVDLPSTIVEGGFQFDSHGPGFVIEGPGGSWPGAITIANNSSSNSTTMTRVTGGSFDLLSVDLATFLPGVLPNATTTFTGTRRDGSTVSQTLSQSGATPLQTFALTGFTNLVSVTWTQNESTQGLPMLTNFVASLPPIGVGWTEPDGSPSGAAPNVGSQVTLGTSFTDANPSCSTLSVAPFTYAWALVSRPAGSNAALTSSNSDTPGFVPDVAGDYQIALQITDALGTRSTTTFRTISTTKCGANLPVATLNASTLGPYPYTPVTLTASASDPDNDSASCPARFALGGFTYSWSVQSPIGASGTLTAASGATNSFEAASGGTYTVSVVATASNGKQSVPASVTLNVGSCGSHAPQILSVSTMVGATATARPLVGSTVQLTANAADADIGGPCGDTISAYTWRVLSTPAGSAVAAPAPSTSPSFSFTADVAGTYAFDVMATDSFGLSSLPQKVSVTTGACMPQTSGIVASSTVPNVGEQITLSKPLTITDTCVMQPSYSYLWTLVSAPAASQAALSSMTGQSVTFTPDAQGTYAMQLVVTDNAGLSSEPQTVVIQAGACGQVAPTLGAIATPSSPDIGTLVTLAVPLTDNNTACGARTQPYAYHWSLVSQPAGSHAALSSTTDAAPSIVPDVPGSYQLSVYVSDALGNTSAPVFATMTTSSCGVNVPVVSISPAGASVNATAMIAKTLTASATDADDLCAAQFHVSGYTYSWRIVTAPIGAQASLSSSSTASTDFTAQQTGTYLVEVVAKASSGMQSAPARVAMVVSQCGATPPVVVSVATKVNGVDTSRPPVGSTVSLTAAAVDADNADGGVCATGLGQTFTWTWKVASLPAGATAPTLPVNSASPTLSFVAGAAGTYAFDVIATDSAGFSSAPFRVSIPTGACGPGLTGIGVSNPSPMVGSAVTLSHQPAVISDACVANGTLSYAWSVTSRPATSSAGFANPSLEAQTFTPDIAGSYTLQLVVTDNGGFSTLAQTVIRAGGCSAGPTLTSNPIAISVREPDGSTPPVGGPFRDDRFTLSIPPGNISLGGCGTTAGSQLSYEWALIGKPAGSAASLDSTTASAASFTADVPNGTWQAMAIVRDGNGNASAPAFVTVTTGSCGANRAVPTVTVTPNANPYTFAQVALSASATDPNAGCPARFVGAPYTFAWSLSSQPVDSAGSKLVPTGSTATFTALSPGVYGVSVVATGADGLASAPVTTPITADVCGYHAPAIAGVTATQAASGLAAPATLDANLDVVIAANVTDADNTACNVTPPQSATVSFAMVSKPAGSAAQVSASGHIVPDLAGPYTVQVTATDSTGLSSQTTFGFNVSATCGTHAPVATAFNAVQTLPDGAQLTSSSSAPQALDLGFPVDVAATVADADTACGLPLRVTYAWSLDAVPAGSRSALNAATSALTGFTPDMAGTYTLRLTLTDQAGLSSSQTFDVTTACGAAGPQIALFKATQTVPSVQTTAGVVQNFTISHSTAPASDTNAAVPFYARQPVLFSATVTDGDGACGYPETLQYAWAFTKVPVGSVAALNNPASATPSFVPDVAGEYDVQLTVTDSTGRSSTQAFSTNTNGAIVGVSQCGTLLPTALIGLTSPLVAPAPATNLPLLYTSASTIVALDGSSSTSADAAPLDTTAGTGCGLQPTLAYEWSMVTAPPGSTAASFNGTTNIVNPSFPADADGTYTAQLVVIDGTRRSVPARISLSTGSPDASKSSFTLSKTTNVVADPLLDSSTLTVHVRTSANIPIVNVPVAASVTTPLTTKVTPSSGTSDGSGDFTASVTSTSVGGKTVSVILGGSLALLPAKSVTFVAGPPATLKWIGQPTDTTVGDPITTSSGSTGSALRVQALDRFNNICTNDSTDTVAVTIAHDGSGAAGPVTLSGTTPQSMTNGVAQFDDLTLDQISQTGDYFTLGAAGASFTSAIVASSQFQSTKPTSAVPLPGTFTATGGLQQITLNWSAVTSKVLAGYNLYRDGGATPINGGTLIAKNATSYVDSGLGDGEQHSYQIQTVDKYGLKSALSTPAITAYTLPPQPAVTLTAGNNSVTVAFTTFATTTGYDVERSTTAGTTGSTIATNLTSSPYTDNSANNGTSYYYTVTARNPAGTRDSAQAGPVTPLPLGPSTPTGLTATGAVGQVNLSWTQISNVSFASYDIYRDGALIKQVTSIGTTTYADTAVVAGTTYAYQIAQSDIFARSSALSASVSAGPVSAGPNGNAILSVSPRGTSTCALTSGGAVYCWGDNSSGQLGDGTTSPRTAPVQALGVATAVQVSVGYRHACAVLADGTVKCWGANSNGQIGNGSGGTGQVVSTPATVSGLETTALQVAAGDDFTCAQLSNAHTQCWGSNSNGQLGNATTNDSKTPVTVLVAGAGGSTSASTRHTTSLTAGGAHACALRDDGQIRCWGANGSGQLGNNSTTDRSTAVTVSLQNSVSVSAGDQHTCAVRRDGAVLCWGLNAHGQLGKGDKNNAKTPQLTTTVSDAVSVAAGVSSSCATRQNGQMQCWGLDTSSELGDGGSATDRTSPVAVGAPLTNVTSVFTMGSHSCVPLADGTQQCWGANGNGQITSSAANPTNSPASGYVLTAPMGSNGIAAGQSSTCSHLPDGSARCWGANGSGQLGDGSQTDRPTPLTVLGLANAEQIVPGGRHACALISDGTVKCWGANDDGQLGNATTSSTPTLSPATVPGLNNVIQLAAGTDFTCALIDNGTIKCWGLGTSGQIGDNTQTTRTSPTSVANLGTSLAKQITAGDLHACALMGDQSVKCWGDNSHGQIGDATTTLRKQATSSDSALTGSLQISARKNHTCSVFNDGTLACWGEGAAGKLGNGGTGDQTSAVAVSGISNARAVVAGGTQTCALLATGAVSCWGDNSLGQLGASTGAATFSATPISVTGLAGVVTRLALGFTYSCAELRSGFVQCWGDDTHGALGDGNTSGTQPSPVLVSSFQTPQTAPGAPQNVTATASAGQVTVSWTAASANGTPITSYTVSDAAHSLTFTTADGATLSHTFTGLAAGTTYTFVVTATNSVGTGPASSSASATTPSAPGTPGSPSATPSGTQITVAWTAPSDGGSAITQYNVSGTPGSLTATITPPTLQAVFTSLTPGTTYSFTVSATNAVGTGTPTGTISATVPLNPPSAPQSSSASGSLVLSWTNSTSATSYRVDRFDGVSTTTISVAAQTPFTDSTAVSGKTYTYDIYGLNSGNVSASAVHVTGELLTNGSCTSTGTGAPSCSCNSGFTLSGGACNANVATATMPALISGGTPSPGGRLLAIDPTNGLNMFMLTTDSPPKLFASGDGGQNWGSRLGSFTDNFVAGPAIDPNSPNNVYIGATNGAFMYTTGGWTGGWTHFLPGTPVGVINAMIVVPQPPPAGVGCSGCTSTLVVGTSSGIWVAGSKSGSGINGTLTQLVSGANVTGLSTNSAGTHVVASTDTPTFYYSVTAGGAWGFGTGSTWIGSGVPNQVAIADAGGGAVIDELVYAWDSLDGNLYRSTNPTLGGSWTVVSTAPTGMAALGVDNVTHRIFLRVGANSVFKGTPDASVMDQIDFAPFSGLTVPDTFSFGTQNTARVVYGLQLTGTISQALE